MSPGETPDVHAALASPVRQRVLDVLRDEADAPTAQQLAASLGLHVTTVRFHLEQLEQAGLVAREIRHANRRGRPGVHYRALEIDVAQAQEQMIGALADVVEPGAGTRASVAAGRRWADQLAAPSQGPRETITDVFTRLGFDPEPAGDTVRLRSCPFREAARRHPEVVCQVHLGLAQGLAARAPGGDGVRVGLLPFVEPSLCLITLTPAQDTVVA